MILPDREAMQSNVVKRIRITRSYGMFPRPSEDRASLLRVHSHGSSSLA